MDPNDLKEGLDAVVQLVRERREDAAKKLAKADVDVEPTAREGNAYHRFMRTDDAKWEKAIRALSEVCDSIGEEKTSKVLVVLEGGLVNTVLPVDPANVKLTYEVLDWDEDPTERIEISDEAFAALAEEAQQELVKHNERADEQPPPWAGKIMLRTPGPNRYGVCRVIPHAGGERYELENIKEIPANEWPALAGAFGWDGATGTPHAWLESHLGAKIENPGYDFN